MRCRLCNSVRLVSVVDLGATPPCERFLRAGELDAAEPTYPLHLRLCAECLLLQIPTQITPDDRSTEHAYSACSDSPVRRVKTFVDDTARTRGLGSQSFVVEVSNNLDERLAATLRAEHGPADLVVANTVYAQVHDLLGFTRA